ncbi:carbon storage regulator CsrA [Porcipelethomonas sp.]|uniref:carbon storage regulator CsrA n=1 Tax=Porcipelethomonas sp. TaxID=2981675 RepID=UPI003EF64DC1
MLILSRKSGESLLINEEIEIKIIEVSGDKVKIGIEAPKNVKILRKELSQTMESNKASAAAMNPKKLFDMLNDMKKDD